MIQPKVYVVTAGDYSDHHICGVFSSRSLAEEYCAAHTDGPDIEEYELDAEPPPVYGPEWRAFLRVDGSLYDTTYYIGVKEIPKEHRTGERGYSTIAPDGAPGKILFVGTSYVSEEHALKLAAEARHKYLKESSLDKQT